MIIQTDREVQVPLLGEVRTGHTNLMTREDWLSSFTVRPLTAEETDSRMYVHRQKKA